MELVLPTYDKLLIKQCMTVVHGDQSLEWNLSAFSLKSSFQRDDMWKHMFTIINRYWQVRSDADQQAIFDIFVEIRNILDTPSDVERLTARMRTALYKLYDMHPFDDMQTWVQYSSKIRFPGPEYLDAEFIEDDDKNHTRNKTYTVNDYVGLVTLILQLRLMVPIWGEFISITDTSYGTVGKEFNAFMLLEGTPIMATEPMQKLCMYVKERAPEGNNTAIIGGYSSEEYPIWITALLVVRRLCLADVRGEMDPSAVLVRHISRHVHERVKRTDTSFGGLIKPKTDSNIKGSEENQISLVEGYKIKPELTEGDVGVIRHYVKDPYYVAERMHPGIDMSEVRQALKMYSQIKDVHFKDAQIHLLQWMIAPVVSPRGTDYLNQQITAKLLCVCSAVLWVTGHHILAGLATAMEVNSGGHSMLSETSTKGRLTKEITDKISEMFPHQRKTRAGKVLMDPITAVDNLVAEFGDCAWTLTLPDDKVEVLNPRNPQSRRLMLPHNFRMKMAELSVYVAERPIKSVLNNLSNQGNLV